AQRVARRGVRRTPASLIGVSSVSDESGERAPIGHGAPKQGGTTGYLSARPARARRAFLMVAKGGIFAGARAPTPRLGPTWGRPIARRGDSAQRSSTRHGDIDTRPIARHADAPRAAHLVIGGDRRGVPRVLPRPRASGDPRR